MRKLSWTLLLPLLLLFTQQGELRHEYGHYGRQAAACEKAPVDIDHCLDCLAFAQIGGVARADCVAPVLLAGLSFRLDSLPLGVAAAADAPAPRSRGPPSL